MINKTELQPVIVTLDAETHQQAASVASEQSNPEIGKQTYFNILAVKAVNNLLKWLDFSTDLQQVKSLNPILSGVLNATDLVVENKRLFCIPIVPGETEFSVPPDIPENIIGFVAVQFEQVLDKAKVLGYFPVTDVDNLPETIGLARLQPLDNLFAILEELKLQNESEVLEINVLELLKQGMNEIAEQIGWLLLNKQTNLAFDKELSTEELEISTDNFLSKQLKIAGQYFILRVISRVKDGEIIWRFELQNVAVGGLIPAGFKLRLLTEYGENFEKNQAVSTHAVEKLYVDVILEPGEGLIWEIEPIPDDFSREILRF
ncbi:MAG: DUF1822 family protein [Okeania sp. SIO3B5]|uniref:DUF1822 family protein n=1 Tax=Okeania sp. SIO3B5 TaxID=2607811 RepID=UPI0014014E49|nr:DUF1822 family protein [Okeania sp. SIO3B5]NEO56100.1 DUF1822 family protein [Okeania sp. SIO3B5]